MDKKEAKIRIVPRKPLFLEEDVFRLNIPDINVTKLIGRLIGTCIADNFHERKPVHEVCLYGGYGAGKSTFSNSIFSGFDNAKGFEIKGQTRLQKIEETFPKCRHIDYRLHSGNPLIWKMIPEYKIPTVEDDEILIGEWCEYLPNDYLLEDRLEIEIISSRTIEGAMKKMEYYAPMSKGQIAIMNFINKQPKVRLISIVGFGNGQLVVKRLAEAEISRSLVVKK